MITITRIRAKITISPPEIAILDGSTGGTGIITVIISNRVFAKTTTKAYGIMTR
ncbi:MAG: hypothetical protein IPJ16_18400 [Bacteroidales bacterium]|nr:hypothetical protein [Bacteroidales bacterium]